MGVELPEPTYLTVDGVAVATWVLGPTAGAVDDVVMCHGTPWSAQVWAGIAHHLSRDRRVFLWDMPGYGRSIDPGAPLDLATQMARFAQLQTLWGASRPHIVAHDIGGAVALGAHLLHGSEYKSLFLWDIVTLDPWGSPFFRLVADNAAVFERLPAALHTALVREYIAGAGNHLLSDEWLDRLCRPWIDEVGQTTFYRQIAALRPEHTRPLVDRLSKVRCRTRVGWGADDPWIPVEQAGRLRELLPDDPEVVVLDGVGHLAPVQAPTEVGAAISDWLALLHTGGDAHRRR
ncbi:alpha/beta fold hydrolase [Gordonia soli]|nr:alpha/beta hydrolase [Gordonia soli]